MSFTRYLYMLADFGIIILICCKKDTFADQSDELFTCGFETGLCSMEHGSTGHFQWTKHHGLSHQSSGPASAYRRDYYIDLNVGSRFPSMKAIIKTGPLPYCGDLCVSFACHMFGADIGSLRVTTTHPRKTIFFKEGNQGDRWRLIQLNANVKWGSRITFEGLTGSGQLGNIALDEIDVARCESQDNDPCNPVEHNCPGGQRCSPDGDVYRCSCAQGYDMLDGGNTCQDIDECTTDHGCSQRCTNTDGSYTCTCDIGYRSMDDGRTCQDIDECEGGRLCDHSCNNTRGSYHCYCPEGYGLLSNGHTCTACSPGRFGHGCRQECHCAGGEGCDVTTGTCPLAACADGYTGDTCSEGCADEYQQVLDSSKAFTSTCPVVEEIIQIELDRCFRKACEGATVNMVTYRSPVCVLRLCQPGEYQLKPSVGILGWDIYLRNTTSPMGQINGESFPLWQILVGLVIGLVVLVTLAVVIGIKRRRPSPAMGTAKAHVRCVSDPGLAPPGGQGENAIYDEITETKTIDGPRDKTVVLSTREQGAAFYQNRMLPPIDNDPVYCDDMATAPPGGRGAGDTSSDCVAYVESTDWETHETDVTEMAGSTGCSDGRDYQNSNFPNGDKYEVLAPTAPVSSIQYEALQ